MADKYYNRMVDSLLELYLETFGAVLIEGPKWCGKTTTAIQQSNSVLNLQNPDTLEGYLATAKVKPSLLLMGDTPRLLDEWQVAPVLWDSVRSMVDARNESGQFILTGSNAVDDSQIMHSGTGRIARLKMLPMSLYESRESNGKISLRELFDNPDYDFDGVTSDMQIEQLIFAACRGGWPAALNKKSDAAKLLVATNYLDSVCDVDASRVDGVRRDSNLVRLVIRAYARNLATLAKKTVLINDVKANDENISSNTFDSYVSALSKLFVVSDIDAWCPAIRSSKTARSGPKRCFTDPSIAVAALGLTPGKLMMDLKTFGFIFECMAIRDLKAYSQNMGSRISYYHDRYDLEADAVMHLKDGRYALIEFKLGSREIDDGAKHLLELKHLIIERNKTERQIQIRVPDLLLIITGGTMAYTREDGVRVVPLACLRD